MNFTSFLPHYSNIPLFHSPGFQGLRIALTPCLDMTKAKAFSYSCRGKVCWVKQLEVHLLLGDQIQGLVELFVVVTDGPEDLQLVADDRLHVDLDLLVDRHGHDGTVFSWWRKRRPPGLSRSRWPRRRKSAPPSVLSRMNFTGSS
jgi:hypothetical protein